MHRCVARSAVLHPVNPPPFSSFQSAEVEPARRLHVKVQLLEQLPWHAAVSALGVDAIAEQVLPVMGALLDQATASVAIGAEDAEDLLLRLLCMLSTLLSQLACAPTVQQHGALGLLASLLAVCRHVGAAQLRMDHPQLVRCCWCDTGDFPPRKEQLK